jgi:hypothetical protein
MSGVYLSPQVLIIMRRIEQTKLSDFTETEDEPISIETTDTQPTLVLTVEVPPPRPKGQMWYKTINKDETWGVCSFDGTVLLVQLVDGKIYTHGEEAVCKWCGSVLIIREDKVFCDGACKRYQGEFSDNLDSFLHWEGVKSYTLRKIAAETEDLTLEPRDLEPIAYAPNWSILYEYADDFEEDEPL